MSDVIDFLLSLLRDEDKLAEFDQDPQGALQAAGLDGLTGQDVRDAQLLMADSGAARPDPGASGGGGDAVSQITHVTRHYHAAPETTIVQIDDRDTIINDSFNSDDDITVVNAEDSFNSSVENDVTAIQDNDTVIEDNDTVVVVDGTQPPGTQPPGTQPTGPEPLQSEGNATEDITATDITAEDVAVEDITAAEPEPAFETTEAEDLPEPEPEPEPDPGADLDAAIV